MNKDRTQEEIAAEELASKFDYTGKMPSQIRKEIQKQLFKQEKNIIFRLEELKGTLDSVLTELNVLDDKYKDIQGIIDQESTQFNKLSTDVELIEGQKKMIETRMKNQSKLQETLKILLSGLSLTDEEASTLKNPSFSSTEDLRRAEDVVEKVGKFLQFQVDQFRNVKIFQDQVQQMNKELNSFYNLFSQDLQEVARKSSLALLEEAENSREDRGTEAYLGATDMSNFKQALMKRRRLIKSFIQAKNNSPEYISQVMTTIQKSVKYVIDKCKKQVGKNLKSQLEKSLIIKSKCSFQDKINVKITSLVKAESISQPNSLMQWFQDLLNQISGQIDLDLNYWAKFFSFDSKKYKKEDEEIQRFIRDSYTPLFQMIGELVDESTTQCPLSSYCFLTSTLNHLTAKKDEDEEEDTESQSVIQDRRSSMYSYISVKSVVKPPQAEIDNTDNVSIQSGSNAKESVNMPPGAVKSEIMETFLLDLKKSLESKKKNLAHTYQKYLQDHEYKVKYAPPFDQSVYFSDCFRLMIDLFGPFIQTYYSKDLSTYASYYLKWIKEQSSKEEKYENIRMVSNLQVIMNKLSGGQVTQYKEYYKKIETAFKDNQYNYCIDVFCYNFTKFSEMWFKIKSVNPSDLESDSSFNAGKFVKSVQTTFQNIDKEVDPILKRMKKHFCKDQEMVQKQFEALVEYIIEQYTEIEQVCWKALKIKVTPSLQDVQSNLNRKLSVLFSS